MYDIFLYLGTGVAAVEDFGMVLVGPAEAEGLCVLILFQNHPQGIVI